MTDIVIFYAFINRTGLYRTFERGLLGKNGLMMVEDGTMCGSNKACYNGDCKSLSYVKTQMVCHVASVSFTVAALHGTFQAAFVQYVC